MPTTVVAIPVLQRLKAVADESRLAILYELASGERCVCELMEALELKQPLLSFHLRILNNAGLVSCRKEGRWCYYTMNVPAIRELGLDLGSMASTPRRGERRKCS